MVSQVPGRIRREMGTSPRRGHLWEATSTSLWAHRPGAGRASSLGDGAGRTAVGLTGDVGRNSAGMFSNRRNGSTERELRGGLLRPPGFIEEETEAQKETDDFAQGHTANYPGLEPEPPAAQDSPLHCGECPTPGAREPRRLPWDALSQRGHGGVCKPTAEGRTG